MLTAGRETSFLTDLFTRQIELAGLAPHSQDQISSVREIVFSNFEPIWRSHYFKFDISLSCGFGAIPSLRFSCNDFDEAVSFRRKIDDVFKLFPDVYEEGIKNAILDVMRAAGGSHQTTLGFEWTPANLMPRIKIYFEELPQAYSLERRWEFARAIAEISQRRRSPPKDDIAAIAVDFLPDHLCSVKWYSRYRSSTDIQKAAALSGAHEAPFWRVLSHALGLERRAFYYLMRRDCESKPSSFKVYKVYEFNQFDASTRADEEIALLLRDHAPHADTLRVAELKTLAREHGYAAFPAIASVGGIARNALKLDLYYGFKPA